MQIKIEPEWITYEEAQLLVTLSRTTLSRLAKSGEIKTAQVGRAGRINRESLAGYMERVAEGQLD